jgi:hypothetical protein
MIHRFFDEATVMSLEMECLTQEGGVIYDQISKERGFWHLNQDAKLAISCATPRHILGDLKVPLAPYLELYPQMTPDKLLALISFQFAAPASPDLFTKSLRSTLTQVYAPEIIPLLELYSLRQTYGMDLDREIISAAHDRAVEGLRYDRATESYLVPILLNLHGAKLPAEETKRALEGFEFPLLCFGGYHQSAQLKGSELAALANDLFGDAWMSYHIAGDSFESIAIPIPDTEIYTLGVESVSLQQISQLHHTDREKFHELIGRTKVSPHEALNREHFLTMSAPLLKSTPEDIGIVVQDSHERIEFDDDTTAVSVLAGHHDARGVYPGSHANPAIRPIVFEGITSHLNIPHQMFSDRPLRYWFLLRAYRQTN